MLKSIQYDLGNPGRKYVETVYDRVLLSQLKGEGSTSLSVQRV